MAPPLKEETHRACSALLRRALVLDVPAGQSNPGGVVIGGVQAPAWVSWLCWAECGLLAQHEEAAGWAWGISLFISDYLKPQSQPRVGRNPAEQ